MNEVLAREEVDVGDGCALGSPWRVRLILRTAQAVGLTLRCVRVSVDEGVFACIRVCSVCVCVCVWVSVGGRCAWSSDQWSNFENQYGMNGTIFLPSRFPRVWERDYTRGLPTLMSMLFNLSAIPIGGAQYIAGGGGGGGHYGTTMGAIITDLGVLEHPNVQRRL